MQSQALPGAIVRPDAREELSLREDKELLSPLVAQLVPEAFELRVVLIGAAVLKLLFRSC